MSATEHELQAVRMSGLALLRELQVSRPLPFPVVHTPIYKLFSLSTFVCRTSSCVLWCCHIAHALLLRKSLVRNQFTQRSSSDYWHNLHPACTLRLGLCSLRLWLWLLYIPRLVLSLNSFAIFLPPHASLPACLCGSVSLVCSLVPFFVISSLSCLGPSLVSSRFVVLRCLVLFCPGPLHGCGRSFTRTTTDTRTRTADSELPRCTCRSSTTWPRRYKRLFVVLSKPSSLRWRGRRLKGRISTRC